ncbi:hypothetical protein Gxy13693_046_037 [Komagataeibacter xylinus NBRC 13693]|uniref:Fe/B12 periplasmic-binding domain-containing protein n=1 Tax=Komagataeibacter xylinus NBRC 13693 TaxID=1234668 RepID=A0A0D6QBR3_KOMXY|nr:hypothetical protein Gxy13693_046_037 [Komagataeibacter xylinus NBRC 13693]
MQAYPVTVESCGKPVIFGHRPEHAVIHDINMSEMAFVLDLQPYIRGLSGFSGMNKLTPELIGEKGSIPEIAPRYPTLEQIVAAGADLFFAGWNYGMRPGGDVTPESLAEQGIPSLILSESCLRAGHLPHPPTIDRLLYDDEIRLGRVFDREVQAHRLVAVWKHEIQTIEEALKGTSPIRVFLYDSGRDRPFTAGRYALVSELIRLGGGSNIFNDLPINWGAASWETAAFRDPEAIIIVDYQSGVQDSWAFLQQHPLMSETTALRTGHVLVLRYDEVTPSPNNIGAIRKIAAFLHPAAIAP